MTSESKHRELKPRRSFDLRHEAGPFDMIGDVHGCADELIELLGRLGYRVTLHATPAGPRASIHAPAGRRLIFVGDLVDRGPRSPDVLAIVMAAVNGGLGFAVPGNHDVKFVRWLEGRHVKLTHGLDRTAEQFLATPESYREEVRAFIDALPIYLWLESGGLAVAHAGLKESFIGQDSGEVRSFCLYGDISGGHDDNGLPVRYHWAAHYRGAAAIVYGHTPVPDAAWVNNTLCIDTGCCFGNKLSALRWPEREVVSVPARLAYSPTRRPLGHPPVRPLVDS